MKIRSLLDYAVLAPSGDNCQPWRFRVTESALELYNVPEADTSLYNFGQRASIVAHGAAIENICIAARQNGLRPVVSVFPNRQKENHVASVSFSASEPETEPLFPAIAERTTNRRLYEQKSLSDNQVVSLSKCVEGEGFVRLAVKPDELSALARPIAINDAIAFENEHIHKFLFDHIRWSDEEAERTRDGLFVGTLELTAPDKIGFRLLKSWGVAGFLGAFGVPKIIAQNAVKLGMSASAIGVVAMPDDTLENYLAGGRLFQRVWLEATRLGLAFHPMAGIACLIQRVRAGITDRLSDRHCKQLRAADDSMRKAFGLKDEAMVMTFRVGFASSPSARSLRLPVNDVMLD
ncbi:MAG TPA: hypothetical protein VLH56_17855 [Dissulfurispiraceae bacterium]|nr:hypothetical protein [Dissulfurispiraceae bacterium]